MKNEAFHARNFIFRSVSAFAHPVLWGLVQMARPAVHSHFGSTLTAPEHVDWVHFSCAQLTIPKFWWQRNHYAPENVYYINIVLSGSAVYYSHSFSCSHTAFPALAFPNWCNWHVECNSWLGLQWSKSSRRQGVQRGLLSSAKCRTKQLLCVFTWTKMFC